MVIVGGGPAGLSAGLYTSRAGLDTLLIEKAIFGGQIANVEHVENYPGFPDGISGYDLGQLIYRQAEKYGLQTEADEVTGLAVSGRSKQVRVAGRIYTARAIIIAGGAEHKKLGVPGEERFLGKGVSYCATCDGALFSERVVVMVGGGDSAVGEAIQLSRFASKVFVVHRRNKLRASKLLRDRALSNPKLEFVWDTLVEEIDGADRVHRLIVRNIKTNQRSTLDVSGVFIYVGLHPRTDYLRGLIPLDEDGYIPTGPGLETSIPGVFAAGDIRQNSPRQAITAAGDGATAAISAEKYLAVQ